MNSIRKKTGFTLIELLVVIAVISLLSSVVLVSLNSARMKARDAQRVHNLHEMRMALEMYYHANGKYPPTGAGYWIYSNNANWSTLQTALASYMPKLPVDPKNTGAGPWTTGNYTYAYGAPAAGNYYDLVAQFENTSNPQRCQLKNWRYNYGNGIWCVTWAYSPYLYADH